MTLNSTVGAVTQALIAKKPKFDEADLTFVVSDQLDLLNIESKKMINIVAKPPAYLSGTAAEPFY
jgi:hypothetical protein